MIKKLFVAVIAFLAMTIGTKAQSKDETAVTNAVEQLRKAMVDADSVMMDKLTSSMLSYGHSGGHIDDKAEFIQKIVSGKSDFVKLELPEQTVAISKNTAVVRHKFNAVTNDNGKPGEVHLSVLQVWQKLHGQWVLLARQAVKIQ
ncbi:MAG: nuclear transport factor 2 family protein [Chitinophagaceae bacterium]|nr:nuclear transport factor 2 family protein [Chitinophagaceae bacterium]